ncbi:MAG: SEFIR domain-containing protein [Phycisphaerales bacterium]
MPRVFLSYSHDSVEHAERVRELADWLIRSDIDVVFDQYVEHKPSGDGWNLWAKKAIKGVDFVLVICTPTYRRRWDKEEKPRAGLGATYEAAILRGWLARDSMKSERLIPVVFEASDVDAIPDELFEFDRRMLLHGDPARRDEEFKLLLHRLYEMPVARRPDRGARPKLASRPSHDLPSDASAARRLEPLGVVRRFLDWMCPRTHRWLTDVGILRKPGEYDTVQAFVGEQVASLNRMIRERTDRYVDLGAVSQEPTSTAPDPCAGRDSVLSVVQQSIRELVGAIGGDDAVSVELAMYTRRSRRVRRVASRVLSAREPLILLGEPGSGKSLTLLQIARSVAARGGVAPAVCVIVRLGEFFVGPDVTTKDVWAFVKRSVQDPSLGPLLEALRAERRLIVMFDGVDEMSRQNYERHIAALDDFAGGYARTVFCCRITDFLPTFTHQRLVLLPFSRTQVLEYVSARQYMWPLEVDGRRWSRQDLVTHLMTATLPVEPTNPFVLWMLCNFLKERRTWPRSRVELLDHMGRSTYRRKFAEHGDEWWAVDATAMSNLALSITLANRSASISRGAAENLLGAGAEESIRRAVVAGVLLESRERVGIGATAGASLRFDHHRWQEFFAAKAISAATPDGLRFDSPRLQETLINVALMDGVGTAAGADAAAPLFQRAIDEVAVTLDRLDQERDESWELEAELPSTSPVPYREEMVASDRIEFIARLLEASSKERLGGSHPALLASFDRGVTVLARRGRPTTQAKMIRAARRVQGFDVGRVAEPALASPVRWLRTQAIVALGSDVDARGRRRFRGPDEEMLQSLADESFFFRFGEFVRMARALRRRKTWLVLAIVTMLSLVPIVATAATVSAAPKALVLLRELGGASSSHAAEEAARAEDIRERADGVRSEPAIGSHKAEYVRLRMKDAWNDQGVRTIARLPWSAAGMAAIVILTYGGLLAIARRRIWLQSGPLVALSGVAGIVVLVASAGVLMSGCPFNRATERGWTAILPLLALPMAYGALCVVAAATHLASVAVVGLVLHGPAFAVASVRGAIEHHAKVPGSWAKAFAVWGGYSLAAWGLVLIFGWCWSSVVRKGAMLVSVGDPMLSQRELAIMMALIVLNVIGAWIVGGCLTKRAFRVHQRHAMLFPVSVREHIESWAFAPVESWAGLGATAAFGAVWIGLVGVVGLLIAGANGLLGRLVGKVIFWIFVGWLAVSASLAAIGLGPGLVKRLWVIRFGMRPPRIRTPDEWLSRLAALAAKPSLQAEFIAQSNARSAGATTTDEYFSLLTLAERHVSNEPALSELARKLHDIEAIVRQESPPGG